MISTHLRGQPTPLAAGTRSPGHELHGTGPQQRASEPPRRLLLHLKPLPYSEAHPLFACTCHPTIIPCLEPPLTSPVLLPFSPGNSLYPSDPFTPSSHILSTLHRARPTRVPPTCQVPSSSHWLTLASNLVTGISNSWERCTGCCPPQLPKDGHPWSSPVTCFSKDRRKALLWHLAVSSFA